MSTKHGSKQWMVKAIGLGVLGAAVLVPAVARADGPLQGPAHGLLGLLTLAVLLTGLGVGFGCFGATVSHVFARRTDVAFKVLCRKPGWSLLAGTLITLLALGLLGLLRGAPPLQLPVLLGFFGFLLMFAVPTATRLSSRLVDHGALDDEIPDLRQMLKGGLVLCAVNAVPILGTLLFIAVLLGAVGASLLGYFTKLDPAAKMPSAPAALDPAAKMASARAAAAE